MSADNWTKCPQCAAKRADKLKVLEWELKELYGVVSAGAYQDKQIELDLMKSRPLPDTLREDYELGIRGKEFSVGYYARCDVCRFEKKYQHREAVS